MAPFMPGTPDVFGTDRNKVLKIAVKAWSRDHWLTGYVQQAKKRFCVDCFFNTIFF